MNKSYIKKILVTIILILGFFVYSCLSFFEMNSAKANFEEIDEEIYEFHPAIEQFVYKLDDDFLVTIIVESESEITSLEYETDGFTVTKNPYLFCENVEIGIKYDGTTPNPTVIVKANLANGRQLTAKIYGVIENGNLYISGNSFDSARDIYLSELLNNGTIDEAGYEAILVKNYSSSFSENSTTTTPSVVPFSTTGGFVNGTLRWQDDWGNWHPLQYTKVSIFDDDPMDDDKMGTVYTNSDGVFSFSFDSNRDDVLDSSGCDIFIKVWPEGMNSVVKNGENNEYVLCSRTVKDVATGSTTTINFDINMSSNLGRAFQVSQAIITASNYASTMHNTNMKKVNVRYPHSETGAGCFYRQSNDTIYIIGNENNDSYAVNGQILHAYASWDVIMHEYGHFVQDKLNITASPGGHHWSDENMYDHYISHHNGGPVTKNCDGSCANPSAKNAKDSAIKVTYSEAWASIFGGMAQQYYINLGQLDNNIQTVGDSKYNSYNSASSNYNGGLRTGEAVESAVEGILWDIYDNDFETHDKLSLGHSGWWNLTVADSPKTFSEVTSRFYSIYSSLDIRDSFDKLLEYYRMAPEGIKNTEILVSHIVPTFTWTANGTSSNLQNNNFRVIIYDSNYSVVLDYYTTSTSTTLTQDQWNSVIISGGEKFYITIGGSQTSGTSTGYYYSALKEFTKPDFQTTLSDGEIAVSGYYSWTPHILSIQPSYNGIPVTTISASAFSGCNQLIQISIPMSVINIYASAFENCTSLKNVILSDNLFSIGASAFKGCSSLRSITIPTSVAYINNEAFSECSSLEDVNILKETDEITNLGEKAFDLCKSTLKIKVPINRLAEYKNKTYWSNYKNKIVTTDVFEEINLDCLVNYNKNITINAKYNKLIKLNVLCGKSYKFTSNAITNMVIYDSNMVKVYEGENLVSGYLGTGVYYLDIRYSSNSASGTIKINYTLTWQNNALEVKYNENTNILSSLHKTYENSYHAKLYFVNNQGEGFFKFSLNSRTNIEYPANAITIYKDKERMTILDRYPLYELNIPAISKQNENEMYVYLTEKGYYYIDIILPSNDYTSLTFNVESIQKDNIDYTNSLGSINFRELFLDQNGQSYIKEVTISHKSKIELDISTNGNINNNIPVYIFEKKIEQGSNKYSIVYKFDGLISPTNKSPLFSVILDKGTYYFGYLDNIDKSNISFAIVRRVNTEVDMDNTLVADPAENQGFELGSEVIFNNGKCCDNTITEGFTRIIYLMVDDRFLQPMSRLDYDWYSSNENVLTVTQYGTVLAHQVKEDTEVTIYAVLKKDPSIVYQKTFNVIKDTNQEILEISSNMSYSCSKQNGKYQLSLNSSNCPYPMIQYYDWKISQENNLKVSLDYYGYVTSNGVGVVTLTGTYKLNPRVKLIITLTINE